MEFNLRVINGEREGSAIYYCGDGYLYHYNNEYLYNNNEGNSGEVYLRCKHWHSRACPGKATVSIVEGETHWTNTHRHICAPDRTQIEVLQLKRDIIQEASRAVHNGRFEEPAELVERIRDRYPPNVAAQVTPASMRSAIQRVRAAQYPPVPVTIYGLGALLEHRPDLTSSLDGRDNLFAGVVHGHPDTTSIIFMSRRMRRLLARSRQVFCDGTFGSRPNEPNSSQVLQIVTVIRNAVVPVATILMSSKTQAEYTAVLERIHQLVPRFNPTSIMTDFETPLMNAWRAVFPNARSLGCYWHYCRAILKKAREMGLVPLMTANMELKKLIRSFCAIPLLPQNLIQRGVESLMRTAQRRGFLPLLNEFFTYFIDTWIAGPFFESLSVYNQPHRTNNVAESANKMLRKKTGVHRPGLWHFIAALKRHERQSFLAVRTAHFGVNITRPRSVKAITNDMRINNFTADLLQGYISMKRFLRAASRRVLNVFDAFVV